MDSLKADGNKSAYSNYGIGTTDICAPGSTILSTVPVEMNGSSQLQFLGEVNAHAPAGSEARENLVSYTSFDSESINPFESFSIYIKDGMEVGSNIQHPVEEWGPTFDGTGVLSIETATSGDYYGFAAIVSNEVDLSSLQVKPRYVSFRTMGKEEGSFTEPYCVGVPVIESLSDGTTREKILSLPARTYGSIEDVYSGGYADLSSAEYISLDDEANGIEKRVINWKNFAISLVTIYAVHGQLAPGTVMFDSIAVGSCRYPFSYMNGTSMASPEVTGIVAVLAGKYDDILGQSGTSSYAEKLAALTKGAGETKLAYDAICATSAYATVDGAQNPGPAIVEILDGKDTFTITGYYMDGASVSVDGKACSISTKALGNDKYEITVTKPAGFVKGTPVITVTGINGKIDRSVVDIDGEVSTSMYDVTVVPEVASQIAAWPNYDVTGYAGKLYVLPRGSITSYTGAFADSFFTFDPNTNTWEETKIPIESFIIDGQQVIDTVADVTACLQKGKLFLQITGKSIQSPDNLASVYVTLDENGEWRTVGVGVGFVTVPYLSTLASDGENVYAVGGIQIAGGSASSVNTISTISFDDEKSAVLTPVLTTQLPRFGARVSYEPGKFVVSGGSGTKGIITDASSGGEIVFVDGTQTFINTDIMSDEKDIQMASGALADGTFMLVGPPSQDGTADTYILSDDGSVSKYEKMAYTGNLYSPASIAYDGQFYVLASKTNDGSGSLVLSYTAVDSATALGDAIAKPVKTGKPVVGKNVPSFTNTNISITTQDIYNQFSVAQGSQLIDAINRNPDSSIVYLVIEKLLESDVPAEDFKAIVQAAKNASINEKDLYWMDISLFLKAGAMNEVQLHQALNGTQATIGIPEFTALKEGYDRTYKVFAYHADAPEGVRLEVIDPAYDAKSNTLTFNISRCSTYAIGYKDVKSTKPNTKPTDTGVKSNLTMWLIIEMGALIALVGAIILKKRTAK